MGRGGMGRIEMTSKCKSNSFHQIRKASRKDCEKENQNSRPMFVLLLAIAIVQKKFGLEARDVGIVRNAFLTFFLTTW